MKKVLDILLAVLAVDLMWVAVEEDYCFVGS